ncbi:hypothetical protein ACFST9_05125 [Hymenobacter monticola]|uniref:Lipoprotein n=1 Tax=Hymenobacter monticola TaxID=1705399 RepID=A0ABY4BA18_9BACT|nr:hypothetical protein [Hymenobacter monticola]UOE36003.1 hypothetical protein MTP16_10255 [Hymenobacter monticola]
MRRLYFGLLAIAASGCTLYQPMLGTLPAVRKPGDVAAAANWQFPYGGQAAAIASPLPHVLVLAAGGLHAYNAERDSSNNYVRNRQYEAGLGGYLTVGRTWLSAAVGAGQGRSFRYGRFTSPDSFGGGLAIGATVGSSGGKGKYQPVPELRGYYNTRFAQVTARWPSVGHPEKEFGATLRLTQARFTSLLLNDVAQPPASQYYLQASVLVQQPLWRRLQWQAGGSYDVPLRSISNEAVFGKAPLRAYVGVMYCPGSVRKGPNHTL